MLLPLSTPPGPAAGHPATPRYISLLAIASITPGKDGQGALIHIMNGKTIAVEQAPEAIATLARDQLESMLLCALTAHDNARRYTSHD